MKKNKKNKSSKKRSLLKIIGPYKLIISNLILISIFYLFISLLVLGTMLSGNKFGKALINISIVGIVFDVLVLCSFLSILLIELFHKKWYLHFTAVLIGIPLLFVVSFAGCLLILSDLKHSNEIVQRVASDKWKKDSNIFYSDENEEVMKAVQMEDAVIVDNE